MTDQSPPPSREPEPHIASVAPPFTRREAKEFLVIYIRDLNLPEHGIVPREEIERLLDLKWGSHKLSRIINSATRELNRSKPSLFFRSCEKLGLVRQKEEERIDYLNEGQSFLLAKTERMTEVVENADLTKLDEVAQLELARHRRRLTHTKRELKRAASRKWLSEQDPKLLE